MKNIKMNRGIEIFSFFWLNFRPIIIFLSIILSIRSLVSFKNPFSSSVYNMIYSTFAGTHLCYLSKYSIYSKLTYYLKLMG